MSTAELRPPTSSGSDPESERESVEPPAPRSPETASAKDEAIAAYRSLLEGLLRSVEKASTSSREGPKPRVEGFIESVRTLCETLDAHASRGDDAVARGRALASIRNRIATLTEEASREWPDALASRHIALAPRRARAAAPPWRRRLAARIPAPVRRWLQAFHGVWLLKQTPLFDRGFYRKKYPDIGASAPEWHYQRIGASERRDPSPFFSTSHYLGENPDVGSLGVNPLVHYLRRGAREGRDPSQIFETRYYLSRYPDVGRSGINPLTHFVQHGMYEGRVAMSAPKIHSLVGPYTRGTRSGCMDYLVRLGRLEETRTTEARRSAAPELRVGVYCNTGGNYFYRDMRDLLVAGLESRGIDVVPLDESSEPGDRTHHVIVAPHEFFYLGQGLRWKTDPRVDEAILVSAEQPHTSWFSRCLPFLYRAKLVLDINYQVAAALRDLGVPAHFFPLGPLDGFAPFDAHRPLPDEAPLHALTPAMRAAAPEPGARLAFEERPIDLLFVATLNERRERFLARHAHVLSRHHCFLHLAPGTPRPLVEGRSAQLSSAAVVGLCQRSKIVLNVHRDDVPYFEWHRIAMLGLWQRALVITETAFRVPWLEPGKHYLEAGFEDLAELIDWTLRSPEGRRSAEAISAAGHEELKRRYAFETVLGRAVEHLL